MAKSNIKKSYEYLLNMAQKLTSSLSNEKLLDLILQEVVSIIPSADAGLIYIYYPEKNKLIARSAIGYNCLPNFSIELIDTYESLEPGEGISGSVFKTGRPIILKSLSEMKKIIKNMTIHNQGVYFNTSLLGKYPIGVISAPLKSKNEIFGVITIDNFCSTKKFTYDDLDLLQSAADIAAVSIVQSDYMKREKQHLKQLEKVNNELEQKQRLLQQTLSIHYKLNNYVLKEKKFEEIVNYLYKITGYPIAIYNTYLKPIALSPNASTKELPICFTDLKNLLYNKKMQKINLVNSNEFLYIFPIIGADKLLGLLTVWVIKPLLKEIDYIAFNYASMILALLWLKQDAIFETAQKLKGEFLQEVLTGNLDDEVLAQSNKLGFNLEDYFCVILIEIKDLKEDNLISNNLKRNYLIHSLNNWLDIKNIKSMIIPEKNYFCILISFDSVNYCKSSNIIDNLTKNIILLQPNITTAIGRIYNGLFNIRKSYQEAKQSLTIMKKYFPQSKVINYEDFGVIHLILNQEEDYINNYLKKTLGPIIKYDEKKNGELLKTLLEYAKCNKSLNLMSKKMNIHINTLYSRIKKIEELLNVDFTETYQWHNIQSACIIYEITLPKL